MAPGGGINLIAQLRTAQRGMVFRAQSTAPSACGMAFSGVRDAAAAFFMTT